jgi:DNA polymerase III sliding clamp (beta) subunit (PCNA family)
VGGQIALNVKLVGDALDTISTDKAALEIQAPTNPGVFKPTQINEDGKHVIVEGHVALVMPMTVR